jgi:hypothetical protein
MNTPIANNNFDIQTTIWGENLFEGEAPNAVAPNAVPRRESKRLRTTPLNNKSSQNANTPKKLKREYVREEGSPYEDPLRTRLRLI